MKLRIRLLLFLAVLCFLASHLSQPVRAEEAGPEEIEEDVSLDEPSDSAEPSGDAGYTPRETANTSVPITRVISMSVKTLPSMFSVRPAENTVWRNTRTRS